MKSILRVAVIGAWMALAIAQTGSAADKTNWVQNVLFNLNAWEDDALRPVRLTTKDVISALNGVTNQAGPTSTTFQGGSPAACAPTVRDERIGPAHRSRHCRRHEIRHRRHRYFGRTSVASVKATGIPARSGTELKSSS